MSTISAGTSNTTSLVYTGDTTGNLAFQINGTTEAMRITSAGKVGVGTSNPGETFVVSGSGSRTFQVTNTTLGELASDGTILQVGTNGNAYFYNQENAPIIFGTNNTERIRIPSDAGGITFPATQVASSDANTLDDYEEGTWTPVASTGTLAYNGCIYTKIGRQVTLTGYLGAFGNTTSTSQIRVGGLPFATSNIGYGNSNGQSVMYRYINYAPHFYIAPGATTIDWYSGTTSGYQTIQYNHINNAASFECYFSITYMAAT